jgi:cation transport regulator
MAIPGSTVNHAFAAHAGQEEASHRIAWAAVKRAYVKVDDNWVACADVQWDLR